MLKLNAFMPKILLFFDHSINILVKYIMTLSKRMEYMVFQPLFNSRYGWTVNLINGRLTSMVLCVLIRNFKSSQRKIEEIYYKFQISDEIIIIF